MKQTIAQQLNITDFPFIIKDRYGNEIYRETSDGAWRKSECNANGYEIYHETSDGYWFKREHDADGNEIYWENSHGLWIKREWDEHDKEIYIEDSSGNIMDNRPKQVELTFQQIADKFDIELKLLRIKK